MSCVHYFSLKNTASSKSFIVKYFHEMSEPAIHALMCLPLKNKYDRQMGRWTERVRLGVGRGIRTECNIELHFLCLNKEKRNFVHFV